MIYQLTNNNEETEYEIKFTNFSYFNNSGEDYSSFSRNRETTFKDCNNDLEYQQNTKGFHQTKVGKKDKLSFFIKFRNNF